MQRDGDRVTGVVFALRRRARTRCAVGRLVVADGARSPLGRALGRVWHRDTAYGVAARGYVRSGRSDDEWISSHLELRGERDEVLAGYGWVFPLADGEVNIGVGTLATARRPAEHPVALADRSTTRTPAGTTGSSTARCGRSPRRCCRWVARCPGWPGRTGR